jgi:uncharacterized cofD-like protein
MDNRMNQKSIVCLGGGVGTVNLLSGLKDYTKQITVVISMADDGGSAGRLRRLYNTLPLGDLISCMAAMIQKNHDIVSKLFRYRCEGERYGKDRELGGHKLGNLMLLAMKDITGNYQLAIEIFKDLFFIEGEFLPATKDPVAISVRTADGKEIYGEEKIDLGKYKGQRVLEHLYLHPENAKAGDNVVKSILQADAVILGPGDLYTNLLPVLAVPEIARSLKETHAKKMFIVNVANKPFETKGYKVSDYLSAINRHIGPLSFDAVFINTNHTQPIPKKFAYTYVQDDIKNNAISFIREDFIDTSMPLYHESKKLAKAVWEHV